LSAQLSSWNAGAAKSAITDFVARVTQEGGPDFVRPAERVAVFDNDGTLWCEQPYQVQVFFLIDRVKELAAKDPSLREKQPFKAILDHDAGALHALGKQGLMELAFATHAGMSVEAFDAVARAWFAQAVHPRFNRRFTRCVYQPQLDLLEYLRAHGFKTFIVSGGGLDVIRAFAEDAYSIPPEQVIGSSVKYTFQLSGTGATLMKAAELDSFDDREAKPANIGLHIGRRPILACGNSDGDLAMMRYSLTGTGARLALLVHHDDGEREVVYDRDFRLSPLAEALDKAGEYGITVVSMKRDWATVFPET